MRTAPAIAFLGLLTACGSSTPAVKRDNLAHLYGRGASALPILARAYHGNGGGSVLYFKLATRDLLYKGDGGGGPYRAKVRVAYEVYADWDAKTLLDSASTLVRDATQEPTEEKELIGNLPLKLAGRSSCVVRVHVRDLNRDVAGTTALRVEAGPDDPRQRFLPVQSDTGLPLFTDHFAPGTTVRVRCEAFAGRTLHGSWHAVDPGLPAPVFTTGGATKAPGAADSTFSVQVDSSGTFHITLGRPGIFFLRPDSAQRKGYGLFAVNGGYPFVDSPDDMLKPLRYITSMQEFDRMANSANVRQAVERFWLETTGDRERARNAIGIYYARVENANRWFTSHVEGWRTDRGLVHIIFGTPNTIHRSDTGETWIYGEENNLLSLTFTFTRRSNPFTDNDLVLERDPMLKGPWYRNVESWRNGRVQQH